MERHENNPNFFLISDFIVLKEYQEKGYGSKILDSTISILVDHNAFKIGAFIGNEISVNTFSKFGFTKDDSIHNFGRVIPGVDTDIFYELKLNIDISLEEINKDNARIVGFMMDTYTKRYSKEAPGLLRPNWIMWRDHLMNLNSLDNELGLMIYCGKIVIGYTYMFYEDYNNNHHISLHIVLDEHHLYEDAVNIVIEKSKEFYYKNKDNHKTKKIKFSMNHHNIIMDHKRFYKNSLLHNGFITDDNEVYYLTL